MHLPSKKKPTKNPKKQSKNKQAKKVKPTKTTLSAVKRPYEVAG